MQAPPLDAAACGHHLDNRLGQRGSPNQRRDACDDVPPRVPLRGSEVPSGARRRRKAKVTPALRCGRAHDAARWSPCRAPHRPFVEHFLAHAVPRGRRISHIDRQVATIRRPSLYLDRSGGVPVGECRGSITAHKRFRLSSPPRIVRERLRASGFLIIRAATGGAPPPNPRLKRPGAQR